MGYTELNKSGSEKNYGEFSLEGAALKFIRESCEGLRFDSKKAADEKESGKYLGASLKEGQIPYNMQMDIDRLCLENALDRFLKSGKKEDAFDVYFCYLEMFVGDYEKVRRMIELLSEYESNGSELLMKHRDHYSHSVYVFALGLAVYGSNSNYRKTYNDYYKIEDEHKGACHYLQYWGLTALFHDIGYPFELPFEQVASYFEVAGDKRENRPFVAYQALKSFTKIDDTTKKVLENMFVGQNFPDTNKMFAYVLEEKLGKEYPSSNGKMEGWLKNKPTKPENFNHYMDHAYFSATVLFGKLFGELGCELKEEHLDSLTAILMHNSLYKFCIAHYKDAGNKPFKAELHPLAYMLMLCDELQCWDRTSYGRNSKKQLHPMGATFDLSENKIKVIYLFDNKEIGKINNFKDSYVQWIAKKMETALEAARKGATEEATEAVMKAALNTVVEGMSGKNSKEGETDTADKAPELEAYSEMYIKDHGNVSKFQADIEKIVDLKEGELCVETGLSSGRAEHRTCLSDSNFIHLYNFAMILNGRWNNEKWKKAKAAGKEEQFLNDDQVIKDFSELFKKLSLEYKLANINQAKAFARYMDEIGCFYTDKDVDFEMVNGFTQEELAKIGLMEHRRWLQDHYDMGWDYGEPEGNRRDLERRHKDMIPEFEGYVEVSEEQARANYRRLDKEEQDKDTDPMECMLAMLKMFDGLRIYRFR